MLRLAWSLLLGPCRSAAFLGEVFRPCFRFIFVFQICFLSLVSSSFALRRGGPFLKFFWVSRLCLVFGLAAFFGAKVSCKKGNGDEMQRNWAADSSNVLGIATLYSCLGNFHFLLYFIRSLWLVFLNLWKFALLGGGGVGPPGFPRAIPKWATIYATVFSLFTRNGGDDEGNAFSNTDQLHQFVSCLDATANGKPVCKPPLLFFFFFFLAREGEGIQEMVFGY